MEDQRPTTFLELEKIDERYRQCDERTYELWMASRRREVIVTDINNRQLEMRYPGMDRQPFIAPYTATDIPQLDQLMKEVGMSLEWLRSEARRQLITGSKHNNNNSR
jgi:hypothetical protein